MTNLLIIPRGEGIKKTREYKDEEFGYSSAIYLHGELERMAGYDLVEVTKENLEKTGLGRKKLLVERDGNEIAILRDNNNNPIFQDTPYIEKSILDVAVDGIAEPCVGIFWINRFCKGSEVEYDGKTYLSSWWQCGLICLKSDKVAIRQALEQQEKGGY